MTRQEIAKASSATNGGRRLLPILIYTSTSFFAHRGEGDPKHLWVIETMGWECSEMRISESFLRLYRTDFLEEDTMKLVKRAWNQAFPSVTSVPLTQREYLSLHVLSLFFRQCPSHNRESLLSSSYDCPVHDTNPKTRMEQ